jgi:hypothetical protein
MNPTPSAGESTIDPKRPPLYFAAIDCPHRIDDQSVALYVDAKSTGTALTQLKQRLVVASTSDGASGDHAELIYRAALSCQNRSGAGPTSRHSTGCAFFSSSTSSC